MRFIVNDIEESEGNHRHAKKWKSGKPWQDGWRKRTDAPNRLSPKRISFSAISLLHADMYM